MFGVAALRQKLPFEPRKMPSNPMIRPSTIRIDSRANMLTPIPLKAKIRCFFCSQPARASFALSVTRARDIAREVGLHFVYTGNVHDETGQSTYCPGCGNRIIGRDWYDITTWRLTGDGRCGICSTAIPGLFEARPGSWGRRRVPIRIGRLERF